MPNGIREWKIHYKYKRKLEWTTTKPCTHAEALRAFNEDFNSLNNCTLVRIEPLERE